MFNTSVMEDAAEMMPEEEIYVNLEELSSTVGRSGQNCKPLEETGCKPVCSDSGAEEETKTWSRLKVATVCLGLLSLVLLISVMDVAVRHDRDVTQLSEDLANHTAERDQLLARNQNLTEERDQLETSLRRAELELSRIKKDLGTCPHGWRKSGCSCYLLSTASSTWDSSRRQCELVGAELVIITSREEMVFLNTLGAHLKFWIGLSQTLITSKWTWTDGRSARVTYWQRGQPSLNNFRSQICAAFNSFQAGTWSIESWRSEMCTLHLPWVCEKEAVPSGTISW